MKQLVIIFIILTGLYSCDDKNRQAIAPDSEPAWGADSIYIDINGNMWPANAVRARFTNDSIISISIDFNKTLSNGELYSYENLYFKMLRKNTSFQKLDSVGFFSSNIITNPTAFFFTVVDVDVLNETYVVYRPDSINNWIQITGQGGGFKKVEGKFSMTLIELDGGIEDRYPDTIRIRNGYFRVTMD